MMNSLFNNELIVDNFAGGGGVSLGIKRATGRCVDIAINHDKDAIGMHMANHPETYHYCEDIRKVYPPDVTKGRPVGLCWVSPDCTHHSKAKGDKPVDNNIRGLAWIGLRWVATTRPRVFMLENVEEFKDWGPLLPNNRPNPKKKGRTFRTFVNALKRQGHEVEYRVLRACDYGAPTMRKRFFLISRSDGNPIVWPKPTHGDPNSPEVKAGKLKPWRTAAEIIDWSIPCKSIFDRKKPLSENTMRRIARGLKKFVFDHPQPFVMQVNHSGNDHHYCRAIDKPLSTITSKNGYALVTPTLIQMGYGDKEGKRVLNLNKPLGTITAGGNKFGLVTAFLAKHYGGNYTGPGADLEKPLSTITTVDHHALVTSHVIKLKGTNIGHPVTEPLQTITAGGNHFGEVRAFLIKYYGNGEGQGLNEPLHTVTTKDRFGLVVIRGHLYQIVDICMRMLEPHELFAAQGFDADYIIDRDVYGKRFSKAKQVRMCGNSVPPVLPMHLVRANLPEFCLYKAG